MNQTDLRRGGMYWVDGRPYVSVTEVLKIINKPQLMYWFGREVYRAMLVDPTMDEQTALGKPYQSSDSAKNRGTTVHSIVESYKHTGNRIQDIPEAYRGYADAFYNFMADFKVELIEQERTLFNEMHKMAGTLDIYAKLGDKNFIIDVKTGKDIYNEFKLQLSAYAFMMRDEGKPVDEIAVLLLETGENGRPTGKYKFQTLTESFDMFLAAKNLWVWNNEEKLIKLGYM
jgi:hypothetical protein